MKRVGCTYNLSYEMPDAEWQKLAVVYQQLPGFCGYDGSGCPMWYGREGDAKHLWASVEPSGLIVEGSLDDREWLLWDAEFRAKASRVLGFEVTDADE
jgi:hypothetical protein